jgi:sec-independent protein translocase protein TatA
MFDSLFQPTHLLLILAVALLVFGPRKLPELGKGLGEGLRGFKEGIKPTADAPKQENTAAKSDAVTTQQTPPSETKA